MADRIRIVVAEPGADESGRDAQALARALRDAGMEVVYTGRCQSAEQIVQAVIQEDADAVGLPGAADELRDAVADLLAGHGAGDVLVVGDGSGSSDDVVTRVCRHVATIETADTG